MNSKKVLIFSRDPGGCNSIAPLFSFFIERNFEPQLFAKDFSVQKMTDLFGLHPRDILKELPDLNEKSIENWLSKLNPDLAITGTSFGDFTERYIWSACQKLKIPSFAILDHWINYAIRFKTENGQYIFPNHIVVPDSDAEKLAIMEGLPKDTLRTWGNPYYDLLKNRKSTELTGKIRQKYLDNPAADKLVVFASEPFSSAPTNYGYNEKEILKLVLTSFANRPTNSPNISLIVRPHPKEIHQEILEICGRFHCENLKLFVSSEDASIDLILVSDLIFGMISQFLIEAAIMRKHAFSIQVGLNTKDPFILTQKGIIPLVTSKNELDDIVCNFNYNQMKAPTFELPYQCMESILKHVERLI